jgi:hypothetical protein
MAPGGSAVSPLFGHEQAVAAFRTALDAGRLHHAWLITGPQGIGKALFARKAALRVLAQGQGPVARPGLDVPEEHQAARLMAAGSHPDFAQLERLPKETGTELARSITVAQVRGLQRLFATTSTYSPWRAVVLDAADDLEPSGANALLKSLEEPPPSTVFLLVSHAPERLLPTIRSACRCSGWAAEGRQWKRRCAARSRSAPREIEALASVGGGRRAGGGVPRLDVDGWTGDARSRDRGSTNQHRSRCFRRAWPARAPVRYEAFLDRPRPSSRRGAERRGGRSPTRSAVGAGERACQVAGVRRWISRRRVSRWARCWRALRRRGRRLDPHPSGPKDRLMSDPFYITTAINYPNGPPHVGHAYEAITADVIARFHRLRGRDVFFMTGTDEHGLKMAQAARERGVEPQALADEMSSLFRQMDDDLNISLDRFIRTTEAEHHRASRALWERMAAAGDIYLGRYEGWYSVRDEAYYDEGELAVADTGEKYSPRGRPSSGRWRRAGSFRLSAYQERLLGHYAGQSGLHPPRGAPQRGASLRRGRPLRPVDLAHQLRLGRKVPGSDDHVMYVWLDALTNYITGVGYPHEEAGTYRKYWPADLHIIGRTWCASTPSTGPLS